MELDWIEDFLVLAELGVFSKAALRRNVTQPAFTRRIRKLEYAVGAMLFDRTVHPVILTPAGEDFHPTAAEMLRLFTSARARLRTAATATEMVSIAALQALATSYLPPLIETLFPRRPGPAIKVLADNYAGCVEALLTGGADLMLCYTHPDVVPARLDSRFQSCTVADDLLVAVSGAAADGTALHRLDDPALPYLRYSDDSFLGKVTAGILASRPDLAAGVQTRYQNAMADGLKSAARVGLGVAWLPLRLAEEDLRRGSLVRISTPAEETSLNIALYRDIAPKPRPVERLWSAILHLTDADPPSPD